MGPGRTEVPAGSAVVMRSSALARQLEFVGAVASASSLSSFLTGDRLLKKCVGREAERQRGIDRE